MDSELLSAATEKKRRLAIRRDLTLWAKECGFEPALHHSLLIQHLEHASRVGNQRLIISMPPGSAKSTYTSKLFPPWFLANHPDKTILACSYSKDLIQSFGRWNRNIIKLKSKILGYELTSDSKAADEWETTSGGRYFCAGVGAGLAGHRADFALIDDPIGSEEDANSPSYREKLWAWWVNDFIPRLKPGASVFVISNRRHEEDLVGQLMSKEPGEWTEIKIRRVARENDPLGRAYGERLWPEYFTQAMTDKAMRNPKASGIEQQEPSPEAGNFFQKDDLLTYDNLSCLPSGLRIFCGSDHAVSERQTADRNCFIPCGVDSSGDLWILPDVWWKVAGSNESVEAMLQMAKRRSPLFWWAERGHISKSILPFLNARMREEQVYVSIIEVTSTRDKVTRAQSIQGRTAMRKVHFPSFTTWWPDALHELLSFPNGKHDDFVDALSEIGQGLDKVSLGDLPPSPDAIIDRTAPALTMSWLKASAKRRSRQEELASSDR